MSASCDRPALFHHTFRDSVVRRGRRDDDDPTLGGKWPFSVEAALPKAAQPNSYRAKKRSEVLTEIIRLLTQKARLTLKMIAQGLQIVRVSTAHLALVLPAGGVVQACYRGGAMPRPPKDDDATQDLKPEDKTQRAKAGTKIGLLKRGEVLGDFRKVARGKKTS